MKPDREPAPEVIIRLRPMPADAPWEVRLRRLLKILKRVYGFRCLSVREVPAGPEEGSD